MANLKILIAGAGPVGIVTGLYLARNGLDVTLFDMAPKPAEDHRAATLQPSTLDLFEELGLTDSILEQGYKSRFFQWRDRVKGEIVAEFDYGRLAEISAHPYVIQLEQHKTVYTALDAASRYANLILHRPAEVTDVRQDTDWVECDVRHDNGEIITYRGDYLVGCDGGRSIVRKSTEVSFDGFTWPERFNIVSTPTDLGKVHGFKLRNYCSHPDRWMSLMQVPGEDRKGLWRCVFPAKSEESDEQVMSDEWINARFRECLNAGPYPIVHRNMYNVHQRVAGRFRSGRILLAGNSAHVNNPTEQLGPPGQVTVTVCVAVETLPAASTAVQVTVVTPNKNFAGRVVGHGDAARAGVHCDRRAEDRRVVHRHGHVRRRRKERAASDPRR